MTSDTPPTGRPPTGSPPTAAPRAAPLTHPLRTGAISSRKPTRFALAPDAATRAAVAAELGLLALPHLTFIGEVRPTGARDFQLEAQLEARVVQACGVTLAPVETKIAETVTRRYVSDWTEPDGDEAEMPEDDTADPMPDIIDAGAVATEALSLALPLYPRAKGAAWQPVAAAPQGVAPLRDDDLKPFAGLAALRNRLGGGTDDGGTGGGSDGGAA
jgi:uncharacterized metal-binding protein YceD (DUF177 family)